MKEEKPRDLAAILADLKNPDAFIRKIAAEECRTLGEGSEAITRALAALAASDENKLVAAAARQALDAPAQQKFLENQPEMKPMEPQESTDLPETAPNPKKVLVVGTLLGVLSATIFALPVSLAKTILAMYRGVICGFPYVEDNLWISCTLNILGSALFGLMATWLGLRLRPGRKGNAWWGFLGGLVFDLLFVFIFLGT